VITRRLLVKKLLDWQNPLLSTRWALASYDTEAFELTVHSYHHNFVDAITAADLIIKETK
jgi:hypothetical protein